VKGATGTKGATGSAGSSGSTLVPGTPVVSALGAAQDTLVTATASCAAGKVLLGGGGSVTTTDPQKRKVAMQISQPLTPTTWSVTGAVLAGGLASGQTMAVQAYALCSQ
jgi:hypothetical protein